MDESLLIRKIKNGQTALFAYFVDEYQDMAVTIAYRILGNQQDAEDVVQNAFVKVFQNIHTFREKSKFSSWLYRIVYNTAITSRNQTQKRREKRQFLPDETVTHPNGGIEQSMETAEQNSKIEAALLQLPKQDAVVITLFYLEEYSVKEVAEIMSLTVENIKIKLYRSRKRLKTLLS